MSQQANSLHQPNLTHDSIIEKSLTCSQIITENDDAGPSNNILMTDKSAKYASISREKKLAKKLKN